jgi:hypothetical protein
MAKVVLQPCGTGLPAKHYRDTVGMFVSEKRMEPFLSKNEIAEFRKSFPGGSAAAWGVTPGEQSVSAKKWQRIDPGDVAFFANDGRVFSVGTIVLKIHNPQLARELWKEDEYGNTWEYMYFLQDIRGVDIPYAKLNEAVGYKENYVIQGFNVLTEEKSAAVLRILDLGPSETPNERALKEIQNAIGTAGEFDPESEGEGRDLVLSSICRRQGQPEFRRKLMEAYSARCSISGCDVRQTLEAAHIIPYCGPATNHPANGLLLRADLHVLFDLGLITVDPSTFAVLLAPGLRKTTYAEYEGKTLMLPLERTLRPSSAALKKHKANSGL